MTQKQEARVNKTMLFRFETRHTRAHTHTHTHTHTQRERERERERRTDRHNYLTQGRTCQVAGIVHQKKKILNFPFIFANLSKEGDSPSRWIRKPIKRLETKR